VRDDDGVTLAFEVGVGELGLFDVVLGDEDPGSHDVRVWQEPVRNL
jgi:hypothetical protein